MAIEIVDLSIKIVIFHSYVSLPESMFENFISHMLYGAGIFTNICPKNRPNVGKYHTWSIWVFYLVDHPTS